MGVYHSVLADIVSAGNKANNVRNVLRLLASNRKTLKSIDFDLHIDDVSLANIEYYMNKYMIGECNDVALRNAITPIIRANFDLPFETMHLNKVRFKLNKKDIDTLRACWVSRLKLDKRCFNYDTVNSIRKTKTGYDYSKFMNSLKIILKSKIGTNSEEGY